MVYALIADDDEGIRESLRMLLEEEGHSVTEATNGEETLERLRVPDVRYVALLDLLMPDVQGVALLEAIVADPTLAGRHAYIILSAGSEALLNQAAPLIATLGGYIVPKPFDIDVLAQVVREAAQRLAQD